VVSHQTLDLTIQVLAAQGLPLPEGEEATDFRPYVKVELHVEHPESTGSGSGKTSADSAGGVPAESKEKEKDKDKDTEYKVKTKALKGCEPDFKGQELHFKKVLGVVPELTFVRFTVRDAEFMRDVFSAWACVRLDRLKQGYRFVHLFNMKGQQTEGVILVKVTKNLA
jgi:phosphatidylinositol phospholipase C delta